MTPAGDKAEGSPEDDGGSRSRSKPEGELGFLVNAVERWAGEHTMMVNAGRLFELMNLIAELRLEAETMANRVQRTLANPEASRAGARRSVDAVRMMTEALQIQALAMSSTPFHHLTSQLPQIANYLAGKLGRQQDLTVRLFNVDGRSPATGPIEVREQPVGGRVEPIELGPMGEEGAEDHPPDRCRPEGDGGLRGMAAEEDVREGVDGDSEEHIPHRPQWKDRPYLAEGEGEGACR